jgi:hypothetical protein
MSLSRENRYLAGLATRSERDRTLDRLIRLADTEVRVSVTLLLDSGQVLAGELAPTEDWAEYLDRHMDDGFRRAAEKTKQEGREEDSEKWEKWRQTFAGEASFSSVLAETRRQEGRVQDEAKAVPHDEWGRPDLDQIADDTAEHLIEYSQRRPTLTLRKAIMSPAMGPTVKVPEGIIRVLTSHVAAWFPGIGLRAPDEQ